MSEEVEEETEEPPKASKKPLMLGLILALVGGGAGFYSTWSGMILAPPDPLEQHATAPKVQDVPDIQFLPVDPLLITLVGSDRPRNLRFRTQLEVPSGYGADVQLLLPRVIDVLNTYLRALRPEDLEDAAALTRIRSQMLRRVELVVGKERINDLLIMEFVIN